MGPDGALCRLHRASAPGDPAGLLDLEPATVATTGRTARDDARLDRCRLPRARGRPPPARAVRDAGGAVPPAAPAGRDPGPGGLAAALDPASERPARPGRWRPALPGAGALLPISRGDAGPG